MDIIMEAYKRLSTLLSCGPSDIPSDISRQAADFEAGQSVGMDATR